MKISILTLFPEMFTGPFDYSIVMRAREKGIVTINLVNIRDFATDAYKSVDDHPYGGGQGMILRVDVVDRALTSIREKGRTILLDPIGIPYTQAKAQELSTLNHLTLVCGHYEGIDERVHTLVDESISIGDYVTTGGELPAMVVVDSVVRLLPDVLRNKASSVDESFWRHLLEYPQYTRPEVYKKMKVPEILKMGDHKAISNWRDEQAHIRTRRLRPDLIKE